VIASLSMYIVSNPKVIGIENDTNRTAAAAINSQTSRNLWPSVLGSAIAGRPHGSSGYLLRRGSACQSDANGEDAEMVPGRQAQGGSGTHSHAFHLRLAGAFAARSAGAPASGTAEVALAPASLRSPGFLLFRYFLID